MEDRILNPKKRSTDENNTIERFCNQVAAELLVPHAEFFKRWRNTDTVENNVRMLVRYFRVSTHVILRQAFEQDKISRQEYEERIEAEEERFRLQQEEREGGGNFYRTMRVRNSRILVLGLKGIQTSKIGSPGCRDITGLQSPNSEERRPVTKLIWPNLPYWLDANVLNQKQQWGTKHR